MPLADWARANGFYGFTRNHGDEIILTNRTARLVFDVDSAQAEINGVNVRLSFPVANVKGVPLIAQLDLDKTVRPLLFPSRYLRAEKNHDHLPRPRPRRQGHRQPRRRGFFGHNEKTYTLALALELRDQLKKLGFNVVLTRSKDVYVDLPVRPAIANRRGADLFVSLHFNATQAGKNEVDGPETYCITPVGAASSNAQGEGGGLRRDDGEPLRKQKPAARVSDGKIARAKSGRGRSRRAARAVRRAARRGDAGDLDRGRLHDESRPKAKRIYDAAYRKQMAAAIVKGILAYQKLTAPPACHPQTRANTGRAMAVTK